MTAAARRAAVAALVRLAAAAGFRDRADAGRALAAFADDPGARDVLVSLVLDAGDTFVTRETAEALLRRHDAAGLRIVAAALGTAEPDHADWIHRALLDVFVVFGSERDDALRTCEALGRDDPDAPVRAGAAQLADLLTGIDPILLPDRPADAERPGPAAGTRP